MRTPVIHYPPSPDGLTKCCGKRMQALPIGDRLASDPAMVTCGRDK